MFCSNCGNALSETSNFCGKCGRKVSNGQSNATSSNENHRDASSKTPETKESNEVNHEKRIKNWSVFYIVFALINVVIWAIPMVIEGSIEIGYLMVPSIIMGLMAAAMYRYKSNLVTRLFAIYYVLMTLLIWGVGIATDANGLGSLFLLAGLIGVFRCWSSASKLAYSQG